MPAIVDNANSAQAGGGALSVETSAWAIAGAHRLLVAGMGWADSAPPNYSAIKWGGSGGVEVSPVGPTVEAGSFHRVAAARLIDPIPGSQTIYGEVSGTTGELCVGAVSFKDANSTSGPVSNTGTGTGTTASPTVDIPTTADQLVVDIAFCGTTDGASSSCDHAATAGQTQQWEQEDIGTFSAGAQSTKQGGGTVTMSHTFTFNVSTAFAWGIIALAVNSAPSTQPPRHGRRKNRDGMFAWLSPKSWW